MSREEASTNKKYGIGFSKKKDGETNSVTVERRRKPYVKKISRSHQQHHQVSSVIPLFSNNSIVQSATVQPQQQQQCTHKNNHHNNNHNNNQHNNYERKKVTFDPILMSYAELYLSLIIKNLVQPRSHSPMPEPLLWWYKPDLHYAYHQGVPGNDI